MRPTTRRLSLLLALCGSLGGLALVLLAPASEQAAGSHRSNERAQPVCGKAPATEIAEASESVHSVVPLEAPRALASLGTKVLGRASADAAANTLEDEILHEPAGADLSRLRVRLERQLRDRPELAPGAARAFARLEGRELAFVVARALATCGRDPTVRATLEEQAEHGPADRREAALLALPPDTRALALARLGLDDPTAASNVRAAAVFTLARGFDALSDDEKATAVAGARGLAEAPEEDSHLRAEALHLVARAVTPTSAAADSALAASTLASEPASAEVALAAARLALVTGGDRAEVARALARNGGRACAVAASLLVSQEPGETPSPRRTK